MFLNNSVNGYHYLYPSALFAEKGRYQIKTILGSCVAVCLYSPEMQIGGINHYMLPLWNGVGLASPKYGNIAIEKLIAKLSELGCNKYKLFAKIFGGADQLINNGSDTLFKIGERNIIIAKKMLKEAGIQIVAENTGGIRGRKIRFDTWTGEVLMGFINNR